MIGTDIEVDRQTATVRLLGDNQMPALDLYEVGLTTITILSTGVLDLNGHSDTVGNIAMNLGVTDSADILLGGGTLTMAGPALTVNALPGYPAASARRPPSAGGTFDIGALSSAQGSIATWSAGGNIKMITVNDTQLGNIATDLHISADLVGASDVALRRTAAAPCA